MTIQDAPSYRSPMPSARLASIVGALAVLKSLEFWRLAMVFVSGLTTLIGMVLLYDSFGSGNGNALVGTLRFVIPPALAGALHAIIYALLQRGADLRRCRYFLMAVPFQLVAIFGSFGAHWTHMRGDSHTVAEFDNSQTAIVRGIDTFVQSYQTMSDATAALTEHSKAQAKNEADGPGDSCGAVTGPHKGPRYAVRMSDMNTFSAFNGEIAAKAKEVAALAGRAEGITASNVSQAMQNRDVLRRIVNEAKMFETDPILAQLRQAAQQRLQLGRGPIEMAPQYRRAGTATTFTCPDAVLDRNLTAVIDAISNLKPVPEVDIKNASDVRVGASLAWQRLVNSILSLQLAPPTRNEQRAARQEVLTGKAETSERLTPDDLGPLAVACGVELGLALLFLVSRPDSGRDHPGLSALRDLIARRREQVFDRVWAALGGGVDRGEVRRVIARFTKFEGKSALILVPVYSNEPLVQTLHDLMHVLTHVGLARFVYGGHYAKAFFGVGWTKERRQRALRQGAVRIYRMSANDYLALILDAIQGAQHQETARSASDSPKQASVLLGLPDHTDAGRRAA